MAIRQRGAGWQADITVKGVRTRETFATEAEAKAWEHRAKAAVLAGGPLPCAEGSETETDAKRGRSPEGNGRTFMVFAERTYERFWRGKACAKSVRTNMTTIGKFFGDTPIDRIDTDAIDNLVAHLEHLGNGDATINRKLAVVSKVLRFAHNRGGLDRLPKIERRQEVAGRIRWLTPEEETKLLDLMRFWGKDEHADVVSVLIDTGMRPNEVYAMQPRDIDLKAGSISIWENKTDHPRTIYMTRRVEAIIRKRFVVVTTPTDRLFPHDNFWLRTIWDRARAHLKMSGDPNFVPYVCRHTCASRMIQRGIALPVVMRWLGHKSIQMTMRYAHLAPDNLREAKSVLEAAE